MYIGNVWVRAVIDKIVERVSDIAPIVKPLEQYNGTDFDENSGKISDTTKKHMDTLNELIVKPNNNNETLTNIRKKFSRDLLKYDAAALEITKGIDFTNDNRIIEIYSVAGNTIKLNQNQKGLLSDQKDAYIQVNKDLKVVTTWDKNSLIYSMLNPQSDKVYGLSPLESLVQTVTAELYSSDYNLNFFYNNQEPYQDFLDFEMQLQDYYNN